MTSGNATGLLRQVLWTAAAGLTLTFPVVSQNRADVSRGAEPLLSPIPRSAISPASSFVLPRNGQAIFYNYDAGLIGKPFLPNVYKSFGFSFDAQYFLYLKAKGRFPTFELHTHDLDTGADRQITDAAVHYAVWSPAGLSLAYISMDASNQFHVSTYDMATGQSTEVAQGSLRGDYLEWSPDGSELLYMEAVALTDRAAEDGHYSYTVHRYSLKTRRGAAVPAADWAEFADNQLVVLSSRASLPYRTVPNPKGETLRRFAMSSGRIYVESAEEGRPAVKRWNPDTNSFDRLDNGQIFLTNARGVVVRKFQSGGVQYEYFPNEELDAQQGNLPSSSITWKIPFQGLASLVQGGSLYTDGSCDGALCHVTAHTGTLGYAVDWQQMPDLGQGDAHALAVADGTVAAIATNVTCNTATPSCNIGWDDYNANCPVSNSGAGNYVAVAHLDGTYSFYGHLKSGSVQVVPGQYVQQGTYLADQGHTGVAGSYNNYLSCGDHLHFQRQVGPGVWEQSVPTDFDETPCLIGCFSAYTSENVELVPAPMLNAVTPSTWTAGSTVQVTLQGQNFTYGSTVAIDGSGVGVSGVQLLSPTRIAATLTIAAGTPAGTFHLTVSTANGTSNQTVFTVITAGSGGSISGTAATPSGTQQLTALGGSDWAHWGYSTFASYNHKAGVAPQISDIAPVGSAILSRYTSNPLGYSWTDGTPAASVTGSTTGISVSGQNNGLILTAPADTTTRTLTVYVGVLGTQGRVQARLSDGSAADYIDASLVNGGGISLAAYTINYRAASSGQTLVVTYTQAGTSGSINLQAATLSGGSTAPDFSLSVPPAMAVLLGATSPNTITVNGLSGFSGSVGFSVAGLPPGVTVNWNPVTVSGGGSTTLTLSATNSATTGTYPVTITATSGTLSHTANANIAVADFSVTADPATRTVMAGGSVTFTVAALAPGGSPSNLSLSASGLPAGVTAVFTSPNPLFGAPVTMTVTASSGVLPGSYPFTFTATNGTLSHSLPLTLMVTAPLGGGLLNGSMATPAATIQLTTEGSLDWAHWGLNTPTDFDHKAGVSQQISNLTMVGGALYRYANNSTGFTWTDGAVTPSASNSTTGVYTPGQGNGFRITVPADTTSRTLRVYVGAFLSRARMVAWLSDDSAQDYVDTSLINTAGKTTLGVYTFAYRAASAGQTLTVTFIQDSEGAGNVTLQAVTLAGGSDFSLNASPASQTVLAGSSTPYSVSTTALNGFGGTVNFSVSGLPAGASPSFSPTTVTGSGSSTLTISTTAATAAGTYPLTITATSGTLIHTTGVSLTVTTPASGGVLSGSLLTPTGTISLTTEGSADWAHWGLTTATDFNHKATVTQQISNFTVVGAGTPARYANNSVGYSWTDGTPTVTATNSTTGVFIAGTGSGFRVTAPADVALRTLKIYVGAWRAQGRLQAQLSDGSAADFVDTSLSNSAGVTTLGVYTLTYQAASNGQTLTVSYTLNSGAGNVTLQAATLSGGIITPDFNLSATPSSQNVAAGNGTSYNVTVGALNGYSGTVSLMVSGLPSGVSAGFSPATVTGSGSSTLTVTTTAAVAPGTYPLTITGSDGSLTHTTGVSLTVTAPDFNVNATPASQSVVAGNGTSYNVTVGALNGYSGTVSLMVSGLPSGVSAGFSPATVTGSGSSTLTVTTTAAVAPGTYPLTITGSDGSLTHTTGISLTVAPPPDFTLGVSPSSKSIAVGANGTFTATVAAVSGFSGVVGFTVSGLPSGVTAGFSPATVTGSGSSTLTLTVAAGTVVGTYPLTITGTSGILVHTAGASLTVTPAADFTLSGTPPSQTVVAGGNAGYTVTVGALSGFSGTVSFTTSGLPGGASAGFSPATVTGSGTSTLTVTTTAAVAAGTYPFTVTGTSGTLIHTVNLSLTVTVPVGGGALSGSMLTPTGPVPLTTEGSADWGHWGLNAAGDFNHKAGVTQQISNYTLVGTVTPARYANNAIGYTWTDGTPTASTTNSTTGIFVTGAGNGFSLTAPADTSVRTLKVYVGAWRTQGRLVAHLSDGSAADFVDTSLSNNSGVTTLGVYTLNYQAAGAGQTLTVVYTNNTSNGNVTLQAATLSGGIATPNFTMGASPSSQTVAAGSSGTYTVTVTALNGYNGVVGFTASGLPSGVSAGFSPATVTGGGSSSLTLTVAGGTAAGSYPVTITGSDGTLSHTAGITLTVAAPDFTVGASPSSQTVAAGSNGTYTVTVTALNGYNGVVGFTASGLPSGVSAGFSPATVTGGGSSSLTLTVAGGTAAGSYPVTITGSDGTLSHTANITLTVPQPPGFSLGTAPSGHSVTAGSSAAYTLTVGALNGFNGVVTFSTSSLPAGANAGFSPATVTGSGSTTLTITTTVGTTPPGSYPVTVTATSGTLNHTVNITLTVTAAVGSGTLNGSVTAPVGPVQLTTEGTLDWAHWGLYTAGDFDHKAGVTPLISNYTIVGGGSPSRYSNNSVGYTWTDGVAPNTTSTNSTTGLFVIGLNKGFQITVPADTTARTLKVYVGAWRAQGQLVAHLSDGSAVDYTDSSVVNTSGVTTLGAYTLTYQAASAGQTLTVSFTQNTLATGNVTLQAATVSQ